MKTCLLAIGALMVVLALPPTAADARYCLRRTGSIGPGRCDFSTREQCMRVAAALPATCRRQNSTFHHSPSRARAIDRPF
jgi:hypothetical protein